MLRILPLAFAATAVWAAEPDAGEIVRRALARDVRSQHLARNYTFVENVVERETDDNGRVKKTETETYEIMILFGEPHHRLIRKNGKPLPEKDEKKERDKLAKLTAKREKESEAEREKRIREYEHKQDKDRKFLTEIPDAYILTNLPEEAIDGRAAYVIDAKPRPGFRARDSGAKMLAKFRGKFWIDKADGHLVKVEAEAIDTVSIGLALIRLSKGSHFTLMFTRVNDEIWLPKSLTVVAGIRLALVKKLHGEFELTYSDYRKFQSDSKIVETTELP